MDGHTLVMEVNDASFKKEVLESTQPTLVDFWAPWCGPCRMLAPILEEFAQTYSSQIQFRKMDIDQNPATPLQLGIRGVPTLILFKNGQIIDQVVGLIPQPQLQNFLQKAL